MDAITADFIRSIEERGIVAYYFKDDSGDVKRIYELNVLTQHVIGQKTLKELNNNWTRNWKQKDLVQNGIIGKLGSNANDPWLIDMKSFLVWCLKTNGDLFADLTVDGRLFRDRLRQVSLRVTDYPSIKMSPTVGIVDVIGSNRYTDEEAVGRIRQWVSDLHTCF